MSGKAPTLAERLRAQRDFEVDLGDGLAVTLRRPPESEIGALHRRDMLQLVQQSAVGWAGFSEATLLGPELGASDPLPFDAEAWAAWIEDRTDLAAVCSARLVEVVNAYVKKVEATRGK